MAESESAGDQEVKDVQLQLEHIYLKDASFESPLSPTVFAEEWSPNIGVDINTKTNPMNENAETGVRRIEVVLTVTVKAQTKADQAAFIIEVQQAGVFALTGSNPEAMRHALATVCPNWLFPYVRETVDGLATRGGFPALHLSPINFEALYAGALERQQHEGAVH